MVLTQIHTDLILKTSSMYMESQNMIGFDVGLRFNTLAGHPNHLMDLQGH